MERNHPKHFSYKDLIQLTIRFFKFDMHLVLLISNGKLKGNNPLNFQNFRKWTDQIMRACHFQPLVDNIFFRIQH